MINFVVIETCLPPARDHHPLCENQLVEVDRSCLKCIEMPHRIWPACVMWRVASSHAAPRTGTKVSLSRRKPKAKVGINEAYPFCLFFIYFHIFYWRLDRPQEKGAGRRSSFVVWNLYWSLLWYSRCFTGWLLPEWAPIRGSYFRRLGAWFIYQPNGSTILISWLVEKSFKPLN